MRRAVDQIPLGKTPCEFLVDVVRLGIELPHVGGVDDVQVGVFACADGELPDFAVVIGLIHQNRAAGAEIDVIAVLVGLVAISK